MTTAFPLPRAYSGNQVATGSRGRVTGVVTAPVREATLRRVKKEKKKTRPSMSRIKPEKKLIKTCRLDSRKNPANLAQRQFLKLGKNP